jgi:hypothetical protein
VDEKATQLHAIASLKVLLDATRPHNGAATSTAAHYSGAPSKETTLQLQQGSQGTTTTTTTTTTTAGTTAGIQELPNGGIAAGLDAGLESVIIEHRIGEMPKADQAGSIDRSLASRADIQDR